MAGIANGLFEPLKIGPVTLSSRIVMGPLGSTLSDENNVLAASAVDYYAKRAATAGTLIVGEATFISAAASGTPEPRAGIWTQGQITSWKNIVKGVHDAGSHIFLQLWSLGRSSDPECRKREGLGDVVSSSDIPESADAAVPRPMTEQEIQRCIRDYATAARNAVELAGFDGVELHGGNGSLIDQFTQDVANKRTDQWGGSIENRSRFGLEITKAVCAAVGSDRVGYRIAPFSTYNGMGMKDPVPQFCHLLEGLKDLKIAYIHLVESRIAGRYDVEAGAPLDPFIDTWAWSAPIIFAGGFGPETAKQAVEEDFKGKDIAIAFGRAFVTNPDLVDRLKRGAPLTEG